MAKATVTLNVNVDASALQPLLAAANGSKRLFWKHLSLVSWYFYVLIVAFNIFAGIVIGVTGGARWWLYPIVALWVWLAAGYENDKRRAEAILRALNVRVGVS